MKKLRGGQNSALENYLCLGREESGITPDPAGGHAVRRAGGVFRVSAAGGLWRSGAAASAVSSHFPQCHRSGGDLYSLLALGGGRGAAVRTHQFAACRRSLARVAGDRSLSRRRHHSQPVQTVRAGTVPAFFLWLVELAVGAAAGMLVRI